MIRTPVLFGIALFCLNGCQPTHLLYVHNASLGVEVSVGTEGTGRMVIGYDRDTFAIVPRKTGEGAADAMSLAAVNCVYADGLNSVKFDHFVSTGEAAKAVARDAEGLEAIRTAIFGAGDTQPCD